ncbi:succinate dehydrogenase cytochrome b subunit [Flavobacterium sp.]|uniref:succinate dehydrogenase cytochrome b subunit n=1 Tax=Flavobacterium sp. TaxID=239 RepID=UPI002605ECD6|nr:succinate dehydrogenase cytochrome b subunit [Flavobacterium sp.]MDD2984794.1 succinate dehydrogenase cytochrome b subunit [Flavobacterium sp.]
MAKSAFLKSSIAKKYWMALTGLFLCLFLVGHLVGNLQLLMPDGRMQFNQYALFMTTNPIVKILSYVTYLSIIFHAVDGIILTIQNRKARPIAYAKTNPGANSGFASRNMAILGTLVMVFIATHMVNFWARMHFDEKMPLMTKIIEVTPGVKNVFYVGQSDGQYYQADQILKEGEKPEEGSAKRLMIKNQTDLYNSEVDVKIASLYKDLYAITFDLFKDKKLGLVYTLFYVFSMLVLAFHLWHGFQSAFQSLGINNPKWTPTIKFVGKAFSVIVPLLFAIIPLFIHFSK